MLGLALLVPLGDRLERRRLITTTLLITAAALALAAASPTFGVFAAAIVVVGVTSVVAQVIVPMSSLALGAGAFACFSMLWTSLAFLLSRPPYGYANAVIGLFGLAGLAGALIAPVAGRLADQGRGRLATTGAIVILIGSWGLLALGKTSLVALVAGIVVLDLGVQALHISNQSAVYALHTEARSRLTTAYMVAYFLGGAVGSAATSVIFAASGWLGVCALGAATAAIALGVWVVTERGRSAVGLGIAERRTRRAEGAG